MKVFAVLLLGLGLGISGIVFAADPATAPAATTPACCGVSCKSMSMLCCEADDKGKVTCAMEGSCCVKTDTKPAGTNPAETKPADGMGGMDMGGGK